MSKLMLATLSLGLCLAAQPGTQPAAFQRNEVMVPMRDGARLQTVILRPAAAAGTLPIILERTPYGVPDKPFPNPLPPRYKELAADGYIFVFQNLRGRFKSEGTFQLSSAVDLANPKATSETTDAYDTIEWLVKHVPANNGRVGIMGVSYDGLTAAMTLLHPPPALRAVSEQASPADQWMNDDMHRYGALRESYAVEYSVLEQADKNANTHFAFDVYDTYSWYLKLGPLANVNAKFLHNTIPYWDSIAAHPNYDEFWRREAWVNQLHLSPVPNLNVAGFWDQEDPWGPWKIFRNSEENDPKHQNFMVAGPWYHGQWQSAKADSIGLIPLGGHSTAVEFRSNVEAPFFLCYLHGSGQKPSWKASTFETGSNTWHTYSNWPPQNSRATNLYLRRDQTLSFDSPGEQGQNDFVEYISDPAKPVPYRARPISPTYPGGDWPTWEVADQRFAESRPDVLTFRTAPLDHNVTVTGPISADLFVSTSGTDSDFIVKLIDVYPQHAEKNSWSADAGPKPGEYARSLDGYELPVAMEVRRGRFNRSYETPAPLEPNQPTEFAIPLRDHDHVFLKGHQIMVQIQSTWFPVIDRNPQKFVSSIYTAHTGDFQPAQQRVFCSSSLPSHIVLPLIQ